ncbi:hypothetical protein OKW38_004596 [Paraburkholderia sp. MM5496-R1]
MPGSPISFRSLIPANTHARWYFWWYPYRQNSSNPLKQSDSWGFFIPALTIFPIPNRPEDIASRISRQKPFSHTGIIHPGW